jgi:hypothetical protein
VSGRIRSVKPEILEDEKTAGLDDHTWRLFVSLFCLADDYGNLRGSADWLHGQVFWTTPETIEKTRDSLATLSRLSLVTPYAASGQAYLAITNWARHQRVDKPGKPRVPGPKDPGSVGQNEDSRESPEPVATPQESPTLACAPARRPDPDHDQRPTTAEADPPPAAAAPGKIPCPAGLRLTEGQRATLETSGGVPGWAIDQITTDFVSRSQADENDRRPLTAWRKCLSAAVIGNWHDPAKRPKPDDPAPAAPTLTQAQVDAAIARDLAEKRAHLAARRAAAGDGAQSPGTIDSALAAAAAARVDPFGKGGRS